MSESDALSLQHVIAAVDKFETAWKESDTVKIGQFLPAEDHPDRKQVLVALIKLDQECRWEAGQRKVLEEYFKEWPELAEKSETVGELLKAECITMILVGEMPTAEELIARFPEIYGDIDLQAIQDELTPADRPKNGEDVGNAGRLAETRAHVVASKKDLSPLPEGTRLDQYTIQSVLGQGSMGTVYLARDEELDRQVAIKVPSPAVLAPTGRTDRFIEEARATAKLKHQAIVPVYDFGRQEDGSCFFVMEYIEGESLAELLKSGPLPTAQGVAILIEIADALSYAHKEGFVQRDVKPANILVDKEGKPHLVDFGLAIHESVQHLNAGEFAGTLAYMAPEQIRAESHRLDGRTDIWAVGAVMYEMLTGRTPFPATQWKTLCDEILHRQPKPPRQIDDKIPKELEQICLKCLLKTVTDRYATACDLARDLRRWQHPRRRFLAAASAGALALVVLLCLAVVWNPGRTPSEPLPTLSGTINVPVAYAVGDYPNRIAVGDVNADAVLDIVTANHQGNTVSVLLGNGDGKFQQQVEITAGNGCHAVAIGDLNDDGVGDIVSAGYWEGTVSVHLSNGDGTFQSEKKFSVGSLPTTVSLGDLDNDGVLDIVSTNHGSSTVSVLLGNGDGTFQTQQTLSSTRPQDATIADFNDDSMLDLVVANESSDLVSVFIGNGNGTFRTPITYGVGDKPFTVEVGDLNGDGVLDITAVNITSDDVSVLLGNGDGTFQTHSNYAVGHSAPSGSDLFDLNNDGMPELVLACADTVVALTNAGDSPDWSGFVPGGAFPAGDSPNDVAVGDFDNDGVPDLAVVNYWNNNTVSVLMGNDGWNENVIAPDKEALLPGATAEFENYTSYSRGINGIMVDVEGLPPAPDQIAPSNYSDYFVFKAGNDDDPDTWPAAPDPLTVTVRPGEGDGGSDRVTIIWADGAIRRQWLQVTVLATQSTGLDEPDVFFYGNAIGESGNSAVLPGIGAAKVNAFDMLGARDNRRNFLNPAPIDFDFDYNRDKRVNAFDMLIARNNSTHFLTALRLITVPTAEAGGKQAAPDPLWITGLQTQDTDRDASRRASTGENRLDKLAIDLLLAGDGQTGD